MVRSSKKNITMIKRSRTKIIELGTDRYIFYDVDISLLLYRHKIVWAVIHILITYLYF